MQPLTPPSLSPSRPSSGLAVDATPLSQSALAALLAAFVLVWFCSIDHRRLVHPDEGRYAEIAREMAASGDWVTPRLNGIKYFEKPALQYWITAAAYDTFGVHHWTARLWPALAGCLGVLFIGYVGLCVGGRTLGLYSAAALGGCVWWILNAHVLTLDAGLSFWMSVGMGALIIAQRAEAAPDEQRHWMLAAWAALALAVLSKGLIGVVLPGAVLVLYSALTRDWSLWRRLHLVKGTLLFLVIAAPWFVVVSRRNADFFDFFFIHEHFTRFLTNEAKREAPWWYFVPIFVVGILPWLAVFTWTAKRSWMDAPAARNGFCWQRFALVWSAFIFIFFSLSGSKLSSYILPIFPALALVIAWQLATIADSLLWRLSVPLVALAGVAWLALLLGYDVIAAQLANEAQPVGPLLAFGPWLAWAMGIGFAGGVAGLWALSARRRRFAVLTIAFSTLIAAQLVLAGYDTLAETRSSAPLLARIASQDVALRADVPFYTVRMYDQTLPYYLGRTVTQVEHPDEMAMGIASEPDKAIATVAHWLPIWSALPDAYAMMQPDEFDSLQREGVPMRELGRDARRVIVARR
jgi:4-amino-4-deoxy-L-arabinose transferase-like glycosyltransferase